MPLDTGLGDLNKDKTSTTGSQQLNTSTIGKTSSSTRHSTSSKGLFKKVNPKKVSEPVVESESNSAASTQVNSKRKIEDRKQVSKSQTSSAKLKKEAHGKDLEADNSSQHGQNKTESNDQNSIMEFEMLEKECCQQENQLLQDVSKEKDDQNEALEMPDLKKPQLTGRSDWITVPVKNIGMGSQGGPLQTWYQRPSSKK